jgi:hypothetical protein
MSEYYVLKGARRSRRPAKNVHDIASRRTSDDGARVVHAGDHTPTCTDCGAGELVWAEAGYVPWHRICGLCGSHWDLHPLPRVSVVDLACEPRCGFPESRAFCRHADAETCARLVLGEDIGVPARCACLCHVPPSMRPVADVSLRVWIDGLGAVPIGRGWPLEASHDDLLVLARAARGEVPASVAALARAHYPASPTWGDLVDLVTDEVIEEARDPEVVRCYGKPAIEACWARRARFHDRH